MISRQAAATALTSIDGTRRCDAVLFDAVDFTIAQDAGEVQSEQSIGALAITAQRCSRGGTDRVSHR